MILYHLRRVSEHYVHYMHYVYSKQWFSFDEMIYTMKYRLRSLKWHHNERDGISNHRRIDWSLHRLFRRRSKKTSKLRVTGFCEGNSSVTSKFPAQRDTKVSIWWRHPGKVLEICHKTLTTVCGVTKRHKRWQKMLTITAGTIHCCH